MNMARIFFNSKDLCLITAFQIYMVGIDSLKIEGHVRNPFTTVPQWQKYRTAIDIP